jgi:transcriptional regulator GlxA family with amidase domain
MVPATAAPIKVGALLFEGFELLDVFGPLEMFGMLKERASIIMLAEKAGSIRSTQGPACVADRGLAGDHGLDVLLVPGGMGTRREVANPKFLDELQRQADKARFVASVCTGSGLLARAGVLDGRSATSNKFAFAWAVSQGSRVKWVPEARWVEDGKFFTSSGVSAGIDMSLGLIARIFDRDTAVTAARWAEYEWHENKDWDPFAKLNGLP